MENHKEHKDTTLESKLDRIESIYSQTPDTSIHRLESKLDRIESNPISSALP